MWLKEGRVLLRRVPGALQAVAALAPVMAAPLEVVLVEGELQAGVTVVGLWSMAAAAAAAAAAVVVVAVVPVAASTVAVDQGEDLKGEDLLVVCWRAVAVVVVMAPASLGRVLWVRVLWVRGEACLQGGTGGSRCVCVCQFSSVYLSDFSLLLLTFLSPSPSSVLTVSVCLSVHPSPLLSRSSAGCVTIGIVEVLDRGFNLESKRRGRLLGPKVQPIHHPTRITPLRGTAKLKGSQKIEGVGVSQAMVTSHGSNRNTHTHTHIHTHTRTDTHTHTDTSAVDTWWNVSVARLNVVVRRTFELTTTCEWELGEPMLREMNAWPWKQEQLQCEQ